ncbi:MAG: transglutaminase domain-containing protein [Candidatus Kapabacteria bacterium]|nr:transglutaminase domain-containing protein [Candidatus Kapabacteria bacterium]
MYKRYFDNDSYDLMSDAAYRKSHTAVLNGARDRLDTLQRLKSWFSTSIKINYDEDSPESASSVFRSRVGSLWGATLLARQLYQSAGFKARIVQLHSLNEGVFDKNYANFNEFREIGLVVSKDSSLYLVLFQRPLQPVNVVPTEFIGQPFVYIDTDKMERSVETDVRFVSDTSSAFRTVRVNLDEDRFAHVDLSVTFKGDAAYDERTTLDDLPASELETTLKKRFVPTLAEASNVKVSVENLEDPTLPLVLKASFTLSDAVTVTGGEAIFQTAGILSPTSENDAGQDSSDRQFPIEITSPYRYDRQVEVVYPNTWTLSTSIDESEIHSDLGDLTRTRSISPGSLAVRFSSSLNAGTYPQRLAPELTNVLGDAGTSAIPSLVFKTN